MPFGDIATSQLDQADFPPRHPTVCGKDIGSLEKMWLAHGEETPLAITYSQQLPQAWHHAKLLHHGTQK